MLPEDESLQIHKVAADGIGQQSPDCYHKIRPEPGRKPRNVPLGMVHLVIIQVKQQAAVVIEHRRHSLDLHGVGIKQDAKVAQAAVNIEDRIQNHPLESAPPPMDAFQSFSLYFSYYLALYGWAVSLTPLVDSLQPHLSRWLSTVLPKVTPAILKNPIMPPVCFTGDLFFVTVLHFSRVSL